ncbi:MAG TPA: CBS domain-containing protein [Crocinitomicaceae bacterium]|nr:CBS domain-containing protein [Crocinitomicaceae bacterium]
MRVAEIMSSPVVVVHDYLKVEFLNDLFNRKNINAVPVLDPGGSIIGIVSSSDSAKCKDENLLVKDIMSTHIHVIVQNNRVKDAAATMVKHKVHHLVVMEEDKVTGMVSSLDLMKVLAES